MSNWNENRPGYKKTKVGWIPVEWECVKLRKACLTIIDGTHFSPKLKGGTRLYITSKNVRPGKLDLTQVQYISESEHRAIYSKCPTKKGQVLLTKDGASVGNACINSLVEEFSLLSSVAVLDGNVKLLDNSYLLSWFLSPLGKHFIRNEITGLAITRLTLQTIGVIPIPLPPLSEQKKIAEILSAWDRAIDQVGKLIDAKQRLKKGLMQQLLTGRFRFPEFDKPARKEGELPKGWKKVRLGKLADISMGTSPSSDNYNNSGVGLPLIQGNADIVNRITNPTRWTSQMTTVCEPDDLIMSVRAPVGEIAKSQHKACVGRGACVIAIKDGHSKEFIFQILLDAETAWHRLGQGSTFACITGKEIRSAQIPVPLQREQRCIASCLYACDRIIQLLARKRDLLQEQKKGLMQKLLTGEVRVKTMVRRG